MGQRPRPADREIVHRASYFLAILGLAVLLVGCKPSVGSPPQAPSPGPQRQLLVAGLLEKIPPGASISVQPDLMSYLGPSGNAYLFPVVGDVEYVLVDVAASQDPLVMKGIHRKLLELLETGQFGVVEAKDGLALLRRGLSGEGRLPEGFYDFLRARPEQEAFPLRTRFGEALELVAYDYRASGGDLAWLATYWRALRPLEEGYRMVFFLAPLAGQQPDAYEDASLTSLWYPPSRWQSGEVIKIEFAPTSVSQGARLAQVAVYRQLDRERRLALPAALPGGASPDGAARILDLAQPPGQKVSLASFLGLPFEPPPVQKPKPAALSLCGQPLEDPSLARLRPVAVKIDNAPGARPQVGLGQACIVYEHLAEGGITRFTAIYHGEEAEVGPVRSARRVDLHIVPQYQAFFAHVGGAPAVMAYIKKYGLLDVDQFFNPGAYYYVRQRLAPYNVYTTISRVRRLGEALGYGREASLEGFSLSEEAPPGGRPATEVLMPYPYPSQGEFRYDSQAGEYVRYTGGRLHLDAADGQPLRARNVIVQRVPSWIASYTEDAQGAPSLDFDLVGEGRVTVFRDGMAFEGKWVRPSLEGWTRFYDEGGKPLPLSPGKIWISLVSPEDRVVVR